MSLGGAGTPTGTTHFARFFVEYCRDLLPSIALIGSRREPTVHLGHHGNIGVTQLARDELVRGAGPDGADRVKVPGIVDPVINESLFVFASGWARRVPCVGWAESLSHFANLTAGDRQRNLRRQPGKAPHRRGQWRVEIDAVDHNVAHW